MPLFTCLKVGTNAGWEHHPSPFFRLRENRVSTVSLAGTRPFAERHMNIDKWTVKEVLEQEYVTRYIHDVLHSFGIRDYRVSSPYVKKAGNLVAPPDRFFP